MNPARILVVEDDAVLAAHLENKLNQMGYQVTGLAATGEQAIQSALAQLPDVLLMDIRLRGEMTGIQAADEIHKSADIPIVYLTAYTDESYLQEAKLTDAYAYLAKPVRDHELRASLEMALYKHQSEQHIQHLNQVLRAVRDVDQLITHERDPQRLLDEACQILTHTRGYQFVWVGEPDNNRLKLLSSAGRGREFVDTIFATASGEQAQKLPGSECSRTKKPVVCHDILRDERYAPWRQEAHNANFLSTITVPMLNGDSLFGVLNVYADRSNIFGEDEVDLLSELANDMAFGLKSIEEENERKQAEHEIQHRNEDLLIINALNDTIHRGEDINGIAETFGREARDVFDCQDVAIYLFSPDAKFLVMQGATLPPKLTGQIEKLIGRPIPKIQIPLKEDSYFKQILANEAGTITSDPKEIQQWIGEFTETVFLPPVFRAGIKQLVPQIYEALHIRSVLAIPLISSGRTIGLLDMSSKGQFTEEALQRVRSISHQMTTVILRKQAEEQVQLQLRRMGALNEIDRAITSSLDIRLALDVLLNEVLSQLGVDAAAVLLLNASTQILEYVVGKGFRTQAIRQHMRLGDGLAGQVGLERRVHYIPNLAEARAQIKRTELLTEEGFTMYFGVPLIAKGKLKGVLEIFHRTPLDPDPGWVNYLETLGGQAAIAIDNAQLFEGMERSNLELVTAYDATIAGWSHALDLRDKETEGHTQRVTELAMRLAEKMGISPRDRVDLRRGALLHDIGKLGVPDQILFKPSQLTDEEWVIMRQHPASAFNMLVPIVYLRPALDIPYCHHEKWDGSGYPRGLKGEQIPLAARLFAVVDVWDALRSDRPYRAGWPAERARQYIIEQSGSHFDPKVVKNFLGVIENE
jgi:response regulator RpfG family c-di-GMP phosphodiesterase